MTLQVGNLHGLFNRYRRWRFRRRSQPALPRVSTPTRGGRDYRELVARVAASKRNFDECEQIPHDAIQHQLDQFEKTWFEFARDVRDELRKHR